MQCFPTQKPPRKSFKIMRWAPKEMQRSKQPRASWEIWLHHPRSRQPASRHQVEARKQERAGLCAQHLHTTQRQWHSGTRAPLTPISTKSKPVRREKAESRGRGQSRSTLRRSVASYKYCSACVLELRGTVVRAALSLLISLETPAVQGRACRNLTYSAGIWLTNKHAHQCSKIQGAANALRPSLINVILASHNAQNASPLARQPFQTPERNTQAKNNCLGGEVLCSKGTYPLHKRPGQPTAQGAGPDAEP